MVTRIVGMPMWVVLCTMSKGTRIRRDTTGIRLYIVLDFEWPLIRNRKKTRFSEVANGKYKRIFIYFG